MRTPPPANRALDVLVPISVYRVVGRRPSAVYVDEAMRATRATTAPHRLSDLVYWRTQAEPGDQIQDRPGGTVLVTGGGEYFNILLAEPRPLEPETAFNHAEIALKADHDAAERLLAEGALAEATPQRLKGPPARYTERVLAADHPLVVDEPPESLTKLERSFSWTSRQYR